jgi:hypothetical protein
LSPASWLASCATAKAETQRTNAVMLQGRICHTVAPNRHLRRADFSIFHHPENGLRTALAMRRTPFAKNCVAARNRKFQSHP